MLTRHWILPGSSELRALFVVASLLPISGCVPLPAKLTYIAPEPAPGLELASSTRGPKDVVKFKVPPDIEMTLIVFDEANGNMIRLYFNLPEGRTFQFGEGRLAIIRKETDQATYVSLEKIVAVQIKDNIGSLISYEPQDKIIGASFSLKTTTITFAEKQVSVPLRIQVEAKLVESLPEAFDLYLPTFLIDGQPTTQPPIHFIRREGTFFNFGGPW